MALEISSNLEMCAIAKNKELKKQKKKKPKLVPEALAVNRILKISVK